MLLAAILPGSGVAAHLVGVAVLASLLVVALAIREAFALDVTVLSRAALAGVVLAGALAVVVVDAVVVAVVAALGVAASVRIAAPSIATSLDVLLHGWPPSDWPVAAGRAWLGADQPTTTVVRGAR